MSEPASGKERFVAGDSASRDDQLLWKQLIESTTVEPFCHAWLTLQARAMGEVRSGVVVLEGLDGAEPEPAAVWPRGYQPDPQIAQLLMRTLRERRGVVLKREVETGGAEAEVLLGFPVARGGRAHGAVAFELVARPQMQLQVAMRQLQWGVAWLHTWVLSRVSQEGSLPSGRVATVLELAGLALEQDRFAAAALAVVTELASRLECDRVSAGFLEGKRIKVCAVSHSAQFGKQMNLIRSIGLAMGEAVDQQAALCYPTDETGARHVLQAHGKLAQSHGDAAVCTVPFLDGHGRAFGAMTFERTLPAPFEKASVELCEAAAALLGPILEEKRHNDRWLITKARDSARTQIKRLVGPSFLVRKLVAAGVLALTLFFTFAKTTYRVTSEAALEGEVRRAVTAPFDGFVFDAAVRGGDLVKDGQVMCNLDVRDLRLEYSKWSSEREQYGFEQRRAVAENDRAAAGILSKKMRQAEAEIALLEQQISRAAIKAPFDGFVLQGDLSQSLGAPVKTGDVLFEVAPLDSYRVMLQVDERDVGDIRVGQTGSLILSAMPGGGFPFIVSKVTPVSRTEEGQNYFRVEGALDAAGVRLRPGMQGFGKIEIERRRLIWIWTHPLIDWIRIKLWVWLP